MSVLHINADQFEQVVLQSQLPVLVDFWATWCSPCRMLGPVIDEIGSEMEGKIVVVKIDVDENQALAQEHSVMSIPTLLVFKNGQVTNQLVGMHGKQDILRMLEL